MEDKLIMKNVTFLIHMLGVGGAERVAAVLCNELANNPEYNISIIRYTDEHSEYEINPKINIYTLPYHENRILRVIDRFAQFVKIMRETKTDTLVMLAIGNSFTFLIHKLCGVKLILSQRNDPIAEYRDDRKKGMLAARYFKDADRVVFQTDDERDYFEPSIREHSTIILNPIKQNLPEPYDGDREKIVVNFCRLERQKNIPLLIDAFIEFHNTYPEYKLNIYGEGTEKEKLESLISKKNADSFIDILPFSKNVHKDVLKAAMFVSTSDYEGISNSMIEAMAIGIPTICTDCPAGGSKMIITDHDNGILVKVGDRQEVVEAMKEIASDVQLSRKLSMNGAMIRERLSVSKIAQQWMEIL